MFHPVVIALWARGHDRMAVLDSQLPVLGCEGLRVMDLSSMYDIVNRLGALLLTSQLRVTKLLPSTYSD